MKPEEVQIGDKVIYKRGARETLYEKTGTVINQQDCDIVIKGKKYYTFGVKFDCDNVCMPENLDSIEKNSEVKDESQ